MTELPKFSLEQFDAESLRAAYYGHGFVLVTDVISAAERAEIKADLTDSELNTVVYQR